MRDFELKKVMNVRAGSCGVSYDQIMLYNNLEVR